MGLLREVAGETRNLRFGDGNVTEPGLFAGLGAGQTLRHRVSHQRRGLFIQEAVE